VNREVMNRLSIAASAAAFASPAYLLMLLAAAARSPHRAPSPLTVAVPLTVLIPAHNEELSIGRAIESLQSANYPPEQLEILVVADNCTDRTAEIAAGYGAIVTERDDTTERGKGFALAHGITQIAGRGWPSAIVMVDADCEVSDNFFLEVSAAVADGASVVQTDYQMQPADGAQAGLGVQGIGVLLMNRIRTAGKAQLGLSAGLLGSGMAFTPSILGVIDWGRPALAEDIEQHAQLLMAGVTVTYRGDAHVTSPLPVSADGWREQQTRWEAGRARAVRRYIPLLVGRGLLRANPQALMAGLDLLVPPQSMIATLNIVTGAAALLVGSRRAWRISAAGVLAQAAFVLGGLAWVRAPLGTFAALLRAPSLVARKLLLYVQIGRGRATNEWRRAERLGSRSAPEAIVTDAAIVRSPRIFDP
jgi:cellulose synthase/poly-beta-1,6-N-acetylglucosamine synthase-like glycosyltransferase